MRRRTLSLLLAALPACTADAIDLFDGGPPDAGPPADAAVDAGPVADGGEQSGDAGSGDAGAAPRLVCPTDLGGMIQRFERARPDLGIEVAAAPDWTAYVFAQGEDEAIFGRTPWPGGLGAFDFVGLEFRGGGTWGGPPQLISYGDDGFSWAGHAGGRDPTQVVGSTRNDGPQGTTLGPANLPGRVVLQDATYEGLGLIFAWTSSTGEAGLSKRTPGGRPSGWRDAAWTNDQVRVRSIRLDRRDGVIWATSVSEVTAMGTTSSAFGFFGVRDGMREPGQFLFDCATPDAFDMAAIDRERVMFARECGPETRVDVFSTQLSNPGFGLSYAGGAEAPAQVAFDGRTLAVARWPDGQPGPYVQFFDLDGDALTEPLWLAPEVDLAGARMDLAGAVTTDGVSSRWILGFVADDGENGPGAYLLEFEGCRLE